MPSDAPSSSIDRQHLHWSSVFFGLGPMARSALTLLVLLALSRDLGWQGWALFALIPSALGSVVRFLTLTYAFEDRELVISEGLISRRSRHVPYERIQQVELQQGPLQRLLRVADVRVESGGSADTPEARLTVLSLARAEALRAQITARRGEASSSAPATADATVLRLGLRDIVLLGLAQGRGMLVIGAAIGLAWQAGELFDIDPFRLFRQWTTGDWMRRGASLVSQSVLSVLAAALAVLIVLAFVRLLSVAWAIVKLHGFTLTRDGDVLRSRYGLVTRFAAAIPRRRVQLLTIVEPPLLRWLGRSSIKVETAGRVDTSQEGVGAQWLAPIVERTRVGALVGDVLAGIVPAELPWQPVAARSEQRLFRRFLFWIAVATGQAVAMAGWGAAVFLPIGAACSWVAARGQARALAYAVTDEAVAFRSGWWTRRTSIVRIPRIQALSITAGLFDRRWGMATLQVDTAGASDGRHAVHVPYLDREVADGVFARLRESAARTDLQW